jgi:hypothetical protein
MTRSQAKQLKMLAGVSLVVGLLSLIGGIVASATIGLISSLARYIVGAGILTVSAAAIYPWTDGLHRLFDRQRRYAYLLAGIGCYVMITAL